MQVNVEYKLSKTLNPEMQYPKMNESHCVHKTAVLT
jgi:hypothetical protein